MSELRSPIEAYVNRLTERAGQDDSIVLLDADLARSNGNMPFKAAFPHRFFDVGIAEQALMSIAAGLAANGKRPFVSTFGAFASMRAAEQVRIDICYHNLDVCLAPTHCGLTANSGATHSATEDLGLMRLLPNMTVIVPGDAAQMVKIVDAVLADHGPKYIRLGRGAEPLVYQEDYTYEIGKAIQVRPGRHITLIACGSMLHYALQAAKQLDTEGISAEVLDMHTIRPLDKDAVRRAAGTTGHLLTVEDHSVVGGLGTAVAEVLADEGLACRFARHGVPNVFPPNGSADALYEKYGLNDAGIAAQARQLLGR